MADIHALLASAVEALDAMSEGKPFKIGTVRTWGGRKFKKVRGRRPRREAAGTPDTELAESASLKPGTRRVWAGIEHVKKPDGTWERLRDGKPVSNEYAEKAEAAHKAASHAKEKTRRARVDGTVEDKPGLHTTAAKAHGAAKHAHEAARDVAAASGHSDASREHDERSKIHSLWVDHHHTKRDMHALHKK